MAYTVKDALEERRKRKEAEAKKKDTSDTGSVNAVEQALQNRQKRVAESIRTEYNGIIGDYNNSLDRFNNGYGQKAFAEEMTTKRLATDKIMGLKRKIESSRSYLGSKEADSYLSSLDDILAKYGDRGTVAQSRSKYETKAAYDDAVEQAEWYDKYSDMDAQARKDAIAKLKAGNGAVDTYGPLPSSETEASRREYNWLKGYDYHVTNMEYDVPAARKEIEDDEAALKRYNELTDQIRQVEQRLTLADRYSDVIDKEATRKELEALYAERDAISITSGEIAAKRLATNQAEDYQALQGYYSLMGNADFSAVSEAGKTRKDNKVAASRSVSATSLSDDERAIRHMTDDEKTLYGYILEKQGSQEADKYLSTLKDTLNQRSAAATYEFVGESDVLKTLYAIPAGFDQFKTGITSIFDEDAARTPSATQYAGAAMRDDLSSVGKVIYDALSTTANMAPSIAAGAAVGAVNPVVGQWVGASLMGASAGGNAYAQALQEGRSESEAITMGVLVGTSEAVLEKFVGGVIPFGKADNIIEGFASAAKRIAGKIAVEGTSEFVEEGLQSVLEQTVLQYMAYGEGASFDSIDWEDVIYNASLGFLTGGVISGTRGVVAEGYRNSELDTSGETVIDNNGMEYINTQIEELKQLRTEGNIGTYGKKAIETAEKLGDNPTTRQIALLSEAVERAVTERNYNELYGTLTDSGYSKSDAKFYAEDLAKATGTASATRNGDTFSGITENSLNPESGAYDETLWNIAMNTVWNNESDIAKRSEGLAEATRDTKAKASAMAQAVAVEEAYDSNHFAAQENEEHKGKTTYTDNEGNTSEVAILGVDSIKDGTMMLKLEGGEVVDASDVSFSSEGEALVYSAMADLGVSTKTADAIIREYNASEVDAGVYALGIEDAYKLGRINAPLSQLPEDSLARRLSDHQRKMAYNLGKADVAATDTSRQAAIDKKMASVKAKTGTKEGKVIYELPSDMVDKSGNIIEANLSDVQKASIVGIKALAKLSPINFHVFRSEKIDGQFVATINGEVVEGSPNGVYMVGTNDIWIDLNAGDMGEGTMLWTAAHEISHYIRERSPAKWKKIADYVISEISKKDGTSVSDLLSSQEAKVKKRTTPGTKTESAITDEAYEELISDALSEMFTDGNVVNFLAELKQKDKGLWQTIKDAIADLLKRWGEVLGVYNKELRPGSREAEAIRSMEKAYKKLQKMFAEAFAEANAVEEAIGATGIRTQLAEAGISIDDATGDLFSVRHIPGENGVPDAEKIAKFVSEATGRSYEESLRWVQAEYSIANIILGKPEFLDFDPDTRYDFIKKNSDYPQGTVDPNNLCRKREEFTVMFDMLQKMYPNKTFTALDVADMRRMLEEEGITVACGACFVEDRRQLLGEIADTFIGMWKEAVETGKPLKKTNAKGDKVTMTVTAKLAKAYSLTKGSTIYATDTYIPNQYDLTTYEGFKKLEKEHPSIASSFIGYNNSRGQQAARLIEGRAEYTRQILNWSDKKVQSVNNQGGLRIFSFSDFQAVSMLDIIQVIIDCSARGVKIQGYTKVPEFAKLIRSTGIKINRSLMPKGDTGIKVVNGKKVLDYDTKEGIDINDEDFLDESDNPNVGNILVGINAEQISLAFLDEFVDYIIPFHTNKSKAVCEALGLKTWQNYKESQHERDIASGKASKHNVNIYTQVIDKYNPTNKVEFVDAFLKECRKQKKVPRYAEFLNKEYKENGAYSDEGGSFDYTYREGYHKLLVDFKMFDKDGNILLQQNVTPDMESSFMETILEREVEKKENYEFPQIVFDRIQDKYGDKPKMKRSERNTDSNRSLLANALETVAANEAEAKAIAEYKEQIAMFDAEQEKLDKLNAEIRELSFSEGKRDTKRLQELRDEAIKTSNRINIYDRRLFKLEATKTLDRVLEREKAKARKLQKQKDAEVLREYKDKTKETREKREAVKKLQKLVLDTGKWVSYPGKNVVKVPDVLKEPYAEFLESIDMSSKRLLGGGEATQNDMKIASAMDSLATAIERVKAAQNPTADVTDIPKDALDLGYLDLPVNFVANLRTMTENIKKLMTPGSYVIGEMTAKEVKEISKLIRTLNHAIKEMSTLYSNLRFARVEEIGDSSISFLEDIGEAKKIYAIADYVSWTNALPYYAFKRFGKAGESIFEELMDGQDKLALLADEIFKFKDKNWTDKEAKAWGEDTHTIKLPSGNEVTLTTADAMGIYCLSRREQAVPHLLGGGIRVVGRKKGMTQVSDSRTTLTVADLGAIISSLSKRQIAVADAIQKFMSTTCAEWGNEISMKRFLTREFTEAYYYPIESSDENLPVKDKMAQQADLYRLLNISATKPLTEGANNAVVIRNIFEVFTNHASDMAKLNAFGMPLLDYMKWVNYREKATNDEGQIVTRGVRQAMNSTYGDKAFSYVLNLIKDVNGRYNDGGDHAWLMKMTRAAKTAAVGSSLKTAVLQVTSYPRAGLILSQKSLALGLTKKPQIKKAQQYCGIALWKSFGFYDTNISRSIEDQIKGTSDIKQKLIEWSLKGAELGDALAWGCLWNACEYEVAQTNKSLKVGSEEFNEAVGKKLREVVYATQVVDSTLTRSQIMRKKGGLTQGATSFMSEPTVSANIIVDAVFRFNLERRRSNSAKKAWEKTGKYIGKAFAIYTEGQLVAALVEALWDAYRDDDDEEFYKKFLAALKENAISDLNPLNKIPIISDIIEMVMSSVGIGYFSSDNLSTTWLAQTSNAIRSWAKVLGKENTSETVYSAIYNSVRAVSSFVGVSFAGAMREVVDLWNNTAGAYDVTLKIKKYENTDAQNAKLLYDAIVSGDSRQAESLKAQFDDDDAASKALKKVVGDKYKSGEANADTVTQILSDYCGMDSHEIYWLLDEWDHADEEDYSMYNDFYSAVESGNNLKATIRTYLDNGVSKETLAGQITRYFKPLMQKATTKGEQANIKARCLTAYSALGYSRSEKSRDIDAWLKE